MLELGLTENDLKRRALQGRRAQAGIKPGILESRPIQLEGVDSAV
jgi:hypothetical protein